MAICTEQIKDMAFTIMRDLGAGYSECIYQNALKFKLEKLDSSTVTEKIIPVVYEDQLLGTCRADIVTNTHVIEVKATKTMPPHVGNQIRKYMLHIRNMDGIARTGLIINFNQSTETVDIIEIKTLIAATDQPKVYIRRKHEPMPEEDNE